MRSCRKRGFTLIELMVSIGILLVLAALMVGGLNTAKRKAKRSRARAEAQQLATAWQFYVSDYSRFPQDIDVDEMDQEACLILRGNYNTSAYPEHRDPKKENPKGIPYMDFHARTRGFRDPWGSFYQVELDENMDGKVTVAGEEIARTVAVWSMGAITNGADMALDDICSWKER